MRDSTLSVNKYVKTSIPKDATPVQAVTFVWTVPMRSPEFLAQHRDRLRREWPELWAALNRLSEGEG